MRLPKAAAKAAAKDKRITAVTVYADGFVPNSYRYPCPGKCHRFERNPDTQRFRYAGSTTYDRKRTHGVGPNWVGLSAKGGRLASG